MICAHCGAPVRFVSKSRGYLHALPLAEFRISRREVQDILGDPPRKGEPLHRQTYIHPAQPTRR